MEYVIGVDLGGTQIRAILTNHTGQIYERVQQPTYASAGPQAVMDRLVECITSVRVALPAHGHLLGVGIGAPGPLDPASGVVFHAPNLPGWQNIPLRALLSERTGLPIELGNDANAAALGEWHFGGAKGRTHMVYITVSTGIGAGVIVDGRLILGRMGAGAELGHVVIDAEGCRTWESLASGTALGVAAATAMAQHPHTLLHQLATPKTVTAADVAQAAAQGDALAQALMQREGELLGVGFVNALHLFSPEIILVGGSVVTSNPSLLEDARRVVQAHVIADVYRQVPIEVASLGENVGVLGAAALVFYQHEVQTYTFS